MYKKIVYLNVKHAKIIYHVIHVEVIDKDNYVNAKQENMTIIVLKIVKVIIIL